MDLNTILIILGVIALIALVVHGLWSNRREKSKYFKSANTFNRTSKNGEVNPFSQAADPNADIRLTHRAQAALQERSFAQELRVHDPSGTARFRTADRLREPEVGR